MQSAVAASRDEYHAHRAEYLLNLEGHGGLSSTTSGISRDFRHCEWSRRKLSIEQSSANGEESGIGAASEAEQKSPAEEAASTASGRLRERITSSGYEPSHIGFGASDCRSGVNGEVDDHVEQLLHECRSRRSAHSLDTGPFGDRFAHALVDTRAIHTMTSSPFRPCEMERSLRVLDARSGGGLHQEVRAQDGGADAEDHADVLFHSRRAPDVEGARGPREPGAEGFQVVAAGRPAAPRGLNSPADLAVPDSFGALTKLNSLGSSPEEPTPADEDYVPVKGLILVGGTYDVAKQAAWEYECGIDQGKRLFRIADRALFGPRPDGAELVW